MVVGAPAGRAVVGGGVVVVVGATTCSKSARARPRRRSRSAPSRARRACPRRRGTRASSRALSSRARAVPDLGHHVVGAIGVAGGAVGVEPGPAERVLRASRRAADARPVLDLRPSPTRWGSSGSGRAGPTRPAAAPASAPPARRRAAARSGRRGTSLVAGNVNIGNAVGSGLRNAYTSARRSEADRPLSRLSAPTLLSATLFARNGLRDHRVDRRARERADEVLLALDATEVGGGVGLPLAVLHVLVVARPHVRERVVTVEVVAPRRRDVEPGVLCRAPGVGKKIGTSPIAFTISRNPAKSTSR